MRGYSFDLLLISLGRSRTAKKRNTSAAGIGYKTKNSSLSVQKSSDAMAENTTVYISRICGKCLNVKITVINRLKFAILILSSEQGRNYCGCAGPKTLLSFIA